MQFDPKTLQVGSGPSLPSLVDTRLHSALLRTCVSTSSSHFSREASGSLLRGVVSIVEPEKLLETFVPFLSDPELLRADLVGSVGGVLHGRHSVLDVYFKVY